ncbi:peptidase domain-containing ABC transporter [Pseudoxanthomonas indica]|uniref:ATP-binding cassette, subfamily B, RaxB n=1 Tax=Pseudoxanthomonas indica TaxID=428993 RepID=A0A1T5KUH4_9GAMM|nr:peptidase domain-containing ABC transporter [Pseudoxanthomonas indica]GGD51873.1 toxin transporter [Pseudoxanthomonas indica]SKC67436.1 ATP-binding cassette, subfamily B, RaxB [Pseudoxanthomonas indica]
MDVYLQSEASECGLACLAMIASYHGDSRGLRALRGSHSVSQKGATLLRLIEIAGDLGLRARALRVELNDVGKLELPCLLHWELNHFVVLKAVRRNRLTIVDPAVGTMQFTWAEFSRKFSGIALELAPQGNFQPTAKPPTISLRQLGGDIHNLKRSLGFVLALSMALQVFVMLAPFHLQWIVDHALILADRDLVTLLGLGFLAIFILQVGIGFLRAWTVMHLSSQVGMQWLCNLSSHLFRLPLAFFEKRHLGDVASRFSSVQSIQRAVTTSLVEAIVDGAMAILTIALMLLYSWKLALVSLVATTGYMALRALSFHPLRHGTEAQLMMRARQDSHLLETLRGMQSIKVSGSEPLRLAAFQNLIVRTVDRDVSLARLGLLFSCSSQIIFGLERLTVIWLGAILTLENIFSVGMLIAYMAYRDQFSSRISSLIDKGVEFRMLGLHGERLADIALTAPQPVVGEAKILTAGNASLSVANLSFRYAPHEPWILHDCSFEVADGESIAIVGPSGCGKSTLLKLLLGLLDPDKGVIRIGGQGLDAKHHRSYRQQVGAVMQDDVLFAGSVAENIALGHEVVDPVRVERAARLAAIHDDVLAMPMGYRTLAGDMGSAFSGGQKQRILLARALYCEPHILFLDEASSHLDVTCERKVNLAIGRLPLTRIVVAHRPETIASADRILVMEAGRIVREHKRECAEVDLPSFGEACS